MQKVTNEDICACMQLILNFTFLIFLDKIITYDIECFIGQMVNFLHLLEINGVMFCCSLHPKTPELHLVLLLEVTHHVMHPVN